MTTIPNKDIKKQLEEKGWVQDLFSNETMHTLLMLSILRYLEGEKTLDNLFEITQAIHAQKNIPLDQDLFVATESILRLAEDIKNKKVARSDIHAINKVLDDVLLMLMK